MYISIYINICKYMCKHTYVFHIFYTLTNMCIYIYLHEYVKHIHLYLHTYIYIYIHTSIFDYACVCLYFTCFHPTIFYVQLMHIHAHTHTCCCATCQAAKAPRGPVSEMEWLQATEPPVPGSLVFGASAGKELLSDAQGRRAAHCCSIQVGWLLAGGEFWRTSFEPLFSFTQNRALIGMLSTWW